jgi:predicted DNA-binding antitoxin AbrB/MazE fold protein
MTITVEAVYENGILKLSRPLPFQEHEKVQVTVRPAVSRVRQTAGLIGWTGSQQEADSHAPLTLFWYNECQAQLSRQEWSHGNHCRSHS